MQVSTSITRIRRLIRDNDADIFSDEAIMRIWSEIQQKFCMETGLLETYTVLPVPPTTFITYTHRWEEEFSGKPSNVLYSFMDSYTYTQPWEPSVTMGAEEQAVGGITSTHQWESFYAVIQNRILHYFPSDFIQAVYVAFDEKPIEFRTRNQIQKGNEAFKTREGVYPYIYVEDLESLTFHLFPKVTDTYGNSDINSEYGVVAYDEDGNINPTSSDYGVVTFASDADIDGDYGEVVYYQGMENNLYLIYLRRSLPFTSSNQSVDVPDWCVKYIEFGVMSRLLEAETDLFDLNLSKHFTSMYKRGITLTKKTISLSHIMRVYRMEGTPNRTREKRRLGDLPSNYPSLWGPGGRR